MNRYEVTCNKKTAYIPANTIITVKDRETNEIQKFSKSSLTRGYPLEYNQELCNALFDADNMFYKRFPVEFRTDEMTEEMIRKYYKNFYEYYLIKYRDINMSRDYIRHSGTHLLYVPEEQVDQSMCDMFVYANPGLLVEVPDEFIKDEYFEFILNKRKHLGLIPIEYRTVDVCLKFIQFSDCNIKYVPDEVLPEVCSKLGINYNENLNLNNNDFYMQKKKIKRNGLIYIKKD